MAATQQAPLVIISDFLNGWVIVWLQKLPQPAKMSTENSHEYITIGFLRIMQGVLTRAQYLSQIWIKTTKASTKKILKIDQYPDLCWHIVSQGHNELRNAKTLVSEIFRNMVETEPNKASHKSNNSMHNRCNSRSISNGVTSFLHKFTELLWSWNHFTD